MTKYAFIKKGKLRLIVSRSKAGACAKFSRRNNITPAIARDLHYKGRVK